MILPPSAPPPSGSAGSIAGWHHSDRLPHPSPGCHLHIAWAFLRNLPAQKPLNPTPAYAFLHLLLCFQPHGSPVWPQLTSCPHPQACPPLLPFAKCHQLETAFRSSRGHIPLGPTEYVPSCGTTALTMATSLDLSHPLNTSHRFSSALSPPLPSPAQTTCSDHCRHSSI